MAATRRRFIPRDLAKRRVWVYIAVGLFVLVDIGLIAWALSTTAASTDGGAVAPEPTDVLLPTEPAPGPTEVTEPAPTVAVPPTRILAAVDDTTAWRATTGACPAVPAAPELTTDSGETWTVTDAAGAGITAVQDIVADSADIATIIGLTEEDCAPQLARTFVAGDDYNTYPELLATTWHIDPADPVTVQTPVGPTDSPCDTAVVVAPVDSATAAVLCSDQTIAATEDSGETWSANVVVPGALDLAETDSGYIAVTAGARDCAGVQVTQLDTSLALGTSGCLPLEPPTSTLSGTVAVAQAADTIWVWAGDRVWRSSDEGATWQ